MPMLFKVSVPALLIERSVVVALAVDEPIAKSVVFGSPAFACTDSFANGLVEPKPALCVSAVR